MTTLLYKRMFKFNGQNYLYKKEKTAPNEIQRFFGKINPEDRYEHLAFLPKTGITHKVEYDMFSGEVKSYEKMKKSLDEYGNYDITETESVHKSKDKFPYWVTLKGNQFETAYVKTENVNSIKGEGIKSRVVERDYECHPVGYDKVYSNKDGDVLTYSYFPNFLDPRMNNMHPVEETLDETSILEKAGRLINRLKVQSKHELF